MPTTELPQVTYVSVNEIAALSDTVAPHVYRLIDALKRAEVSRNIAAAHLGNQTSPDFSVHSTVYTDFLNAALESIEAIYRGLNKSPGNHANAPPATAR